MDEVKSLRRKLAKRERRIAGMQRRINELEITLSLHVTRMERLPERVTKAVQDALCNVRLIPVSGVGRMDKIVEIREIAARKGEGEA
jgi:hypothetical protein